MCKTFKYRLYPTPAQETAMKATLEECRWLYNHFLEERKTAYEQTGSSPGLYDQHADLPALKRERPSLATVHSQVLQNVAVRVDLAFRAFFRRVREGEKDPGYPRFRDKGRYDSFCFPQSGFKVVGERVRLSRIGDVKAILYRPIEGDIKMCCVRRTSTGKWFVTFSCDDSSRSLLQPIHPRRAATRHAGTDRACLCVIVSSSVRAAILSCPGMSMLLVIS
jgi:putative transposase